MNRYYAASLAVLLLSSPAAAQPYQLPKAGDIVVRGRMLGVLPSEDAKVGGAVTTSTIGIDNSYVPEVDFSYFFTNNISAELIAAITPHDIHTRASSAGALDLADVWLLPPTLTLQYHFTDYGAFKPYVGAGVNYTVFFGEDKGASVNNVKFDNSFGPALQAGADYMLDDHWMLNVDIKKIWINTDVSFNNGTIKADVDINPWVVGVGVGYRF